MLLFSPIVADSPTNQTNRRSLWNCLWEGSNIQSVALRRRTLQIAQQMYLRIIILMRAGPPLPMRGARAGTLLSLWSDESRLCRARAMPLWVLCRGPLIVRKEMSVTAITLISKQWNAKCQTGHRLHNNTSMKRESCHHIYAHSYYIYRCYYCICYELFLHYYNLPSLIFQMVVITPGTMVLLYPILSRISSTLVCHSWWHMEDSQHTNSSNNTHLLEHI